MWLGWVTKWRKEKTSALGLAAKVVASAATYSQRTLKKFLNRKSNPHAARVNALNLNSSLVDQRSSGCGTCRDARASTSTLGDLAVFVSILIRSTQQRDLISASVGVSASSLIFAAFRVTRSTKTTKQSGRQRGSDNRLAKAWERRTILSLIIPKYSKRRWKNWASMAGLPSKSFWMRWKKNKRSLSSRWTSTLGKWVQMWILW